MSLHCHSPTSSSRGADPVVYYDGSDSEILGSHTHSAVTSELHLLLSFCFTRQVQYGGLPSSCMRLVIRMTLYPEEVSGGGWVSITMCSRFGAHQYPRCVTVTGGPIDHS